jgi:hypothetical protein
MVKIIAVKNFVRQTTGRHGTQHNNIQYNDIQLEQLICDTQRK